MNSFYKVFIFVILFSILTIHKVSSKLIFILFTSNKRQFLNQTNEYRKMHQVGSVIMNETINKISEDYAKKLASQNVLKHSGIKGYGENLLYMSESLVMKRGIKSWYEEVKYYDFSNPVYNSKTGHFTQLVWKKTKQVGFGVAQNGSRVFVVCHYTPRGNVIGQFAANVLPLKN
uniref:SCP domain-containing protein n=1 Tax=Parastrongyloides trichosuri TaxID=131310 RepID=A0A0N4Z2X0_PARTI